MNDARRGRELQMEKKISVDELKKENSILIPMSQGEEVLWINQKKTSFVECEKEWELNRDDIDDAAKRLERFAPLIEACFPETQKDHGMIESPLEEIHKMKTYIKEHYNSNFMGRLFLKEDSHLPIAGSVKARGGIYEVLKYTEDLAVAHGVLKPTDSYEILLEPEKKMFFQNYKIQVGSTGNLGLSIGIISAVLGYQVIVHMSADARQWKKDLLRSYGVNVREYAGDYSEAVKKGRALSDQDPKSYFVDDENSKNLFLGYAVAGQRLEKQLEKRNIHIDEEHPLFVYLPCGVGGAPGGISFGLKQIYGDYVHCFFAEPVQAPCMLLGMVTGKNHQICVQDIGLTGKTSADGLAVGRPSAFVGKMMNHSLSGEFTVKDEKLYEYLHVLMEQEGIFLEPSACAGFSGPIRMQNDERMNQYLKENHLESKMKQAVHVVWATGGSLVPDEEREKYFQKSL